MLVNFLGGKNEYDLLWRCKTSSQCLTYKENISFVHRFTEDLFIKRTKITAVDKYGCEKVNLFL